MGSLTTPTASNNAVRKAMVFQTANNLLFANNTITTLEIKTELRKTQPGYYWDQTFISQCMDEFAKGGTYHYTDNGTYRTYSDPTRKTKPSSAVFNATVPLKAKVAKKVSTKKVGIVTSPTIPRLSRTNAVTLMANNKGHFYTVTFIKKDGSLRILNGQYQGVSKLGYIRMTDSALKKQGKNSVRNVDPRTMVELSIGGNTYQW